MVHETRLWSSRPSWIVLFLTCVKQHTSTFSTVCHLHISHLHSTLALQLSRKLIFGAFNFCRCALAMKIQLNENLKRNFLQTKISQSTVDCRRTPWQQSPMWQDNHSTSSLCLTYMAHSKLTTNFQFVHVAKISYGTSKTTSIIVKQCSLHIWGLDRL